MEFHVRCRAENRELRPFRTSSNSVCEGQYPGIRERGRAIRAAKYDHAVIRIVIDCTVAATCCRWRTCRRQLCPGGRALAIGIGQHPNIAKGSAPGIAAINRHEVIGGIVDRSATLPGWRRPTAGKKPCPRGRAPLTVGIAENPHVVE